MSLDQALQKILSNTFTRTDAGKRLLLLQDFLEAVMYENVPKSGSLSDALRTRFASDPKQAEEASAVAVWGEETLRFLADTDIHSLLNKLKEQLAGLPELVLYVPVVLPSAHVSVLGEWCRSNIDPNLFISLQVDPSAIGGCFFVWKNQYYDYSLSHFLDKNREKIVKVLDARTRPNVPIRYGQAQNIHSAPSSKS